MVHNHCTLLFQDPMLWKEKNFILGDLTNHRPQICVIFWTLVWHTVWMVNPPSHGFRAVCLWSCCSMHPGASHAIWIPSTMRPSSHKRWSQLCRIFADQEMMQGKKHEITLLRVIPTMTCWVEVVRWGLSLRIWWEEWRIWEHWFQVSLA